MALKDKILKGAKSLGTIALNAATGTPQTAPESIQQIRKAKCMTCPKLMKPLKQCGECLCFIDYKVTISFEECPLGYWKAVDPVKE